ncbi:MAG: hypothetical protein C0403_16910 [Desulfobacterium sp.]|nr:hypothetical protein [Desulfobacterium sp.]
MKAKNWMMPGRKAVIRLAVLIILGVSRLFPGLFAATHVFAQTVPIEPLQREAVMPSESSQTDKEGLGRYLAFTRPKISFGLSTEFREELRLREGVEKKDFNRSTNEKAEIETSGWLYHSGLAAYTLSYQPEWTQASEEHDPGLSSRSNLFVNGYQGDLSFFQYKPYTMHLFSNRRQYSLKSAFAAKTDTDAESYGADFNLKYSVLPTNLQYMHYENIQSGFYAATQEGDSIRSDIRYGTAKTNTRLSLKRQDQTRTTEGISSQVESANHDLRNDINFTNDKQVRLNSFASFQSTDSKQLNTSSFSLNEDLIWTHTKNFSSDYHAGCRRNEWRDTQDQNLSFSSGFRHLLYENLTTSGGLRTSMEDYNEGNVDAYGGRLNFDYQREIPWGILKLSMGHDYETNRRSFMQDYIIKTKSLMLRDDSLTFLDERNVDATSIIVTDDSGSIIYVNDVDYRLTLMNGFIRIQRTGFSSIKDGDTVRVNYRFLQDPQFDDALIGQAYGISLELWKMLTLGYHFSHNQQHISSGVSSSFPTNDTSNMADAKLAWRWTETSLNYTDTDRSSGISSTTWLTKERITFWPTSGLFFQVTGHDGRRHFKEENRSENFYGLTCSLNWLPVRWCRYTLETFKRDLSGETESTTSHGVESILELSYRIWGGTIRYQFYNEQDKLHDNQRQVYTIYAEIKRSLW